MDRHNFICGEIRMFRLKSVGIVVNEFEVLLHRSFATMKFGIKMSEKQLRVQLCLTVKKSPGEASGY